MSKPTTPSLPLIQFRAARMKPDLDNRRLPGETYSQTVQWCLRQYFDLLADLNRVDFGIAHVADAYLDADHAREQRAKQPA